MRRAIATVSISGSLEEKIQAIAAAGFDGIELFDADLVHSFLHPADVKRRLDDAGLEVLLYQPLRDIEGVPDAVFRRNLTRARRALDIMQTLGAETLLVCSNVASDAVDDDPRAAAQLHELAELASQSGIRIAYEALSWGRYVRTYRHAYELVQMADHEALGLCLDSFHTLSLGDDLAGLSEIMPQKLFFLQLADAPRLVMELLQWSRHFRCFPGQGDFDLTEFVLRVLAAGYQGPLSLELFNDIFRQADPRRTALDGMRSLLLLEDKLACIGVVIDGNGSSASLESLPLAPDLSGFTFTEVDIPTDAVSDFERLLVEMGFACVGAHRRKRTQLWQQGSARIVVNQVTHLEPAARAEPQTTGSSPERAGIHLAALAVESADPTASAARAVALRAPLLPRDVGPGEAQLASIAAPDGTSVFFCATDPRASTGWMADFVLLGDLVRARCGIIAIDHVAFSQPFEAFDEAVLFYRSVLGVEPEFGEDLVGPEGIMRSRALSSPLGAIRMVLNVPRLGDTSGSHPSPLQHIAFESEDVMATAKVMRKRGVQILPIPTNYYDDLAARIDLDPSLLAKLRDLDVLYDRTTDGEFLHFYTVTLSGRMFFEVVQRIGGYQGYGAINSPVRLAAQFAYGRH